MRKEHILVASQRVPLGEPEIPRRETEHSLNMVGRNSSNLPSILLASFLISKELPQMMLSTIGL